MAERISSFAFVTAATTKVPYFAPLAASFFAFQRSTYKQNFCLTQRTHSEAKTVKMTQINKESTSQYY